MCECKAGSAPGLTLNPGNVRCQVAVGTLADGSPRLCPTTVQGGWLGLHLHHLTVHPTAYWVPRPGHP